MDDEWHAASGRDHIEVELGTRLSSSLLLRIRFARFTNVLSLAVEDLVSLLGGVVFTTWMGLGTSSFGRASSVSSHYILNEEKY